MMIVRLGEQDIKNLKEYWSQSYLLTGYEKWPGGKKGCLVYFDHSIHLLDAPWRQLDVVGQYDDLHMYEKMELSSPDSRIVGGVTAVLILKDCLKSFPDISKEAYWSSYYQVRKSELPYKLYPSLFFNEECISWAYRKHELLDAYIKKSSNLHLKENIQEAVQTVIHDMLHDEEVLMRNMAPRIFTPISHPDYEKAKINIKYSIESFDYTWDGGYLDGIQAFLLNYAASRHVKKMICQEEDINIAVDKLSCMIDDRKDSPIAILNIEEPFDSSKLREMFEFYINLITPDINFSLEISDMTYAGGSEKKKKRMLYASIFDKEYKSTNSIKFLKPYLKEDLLHWLAQATRVFFDYLLDCLEGSEYFIDAQNKYYELYPDALPENQKTPSSFAAVSISSFLFTAKARNEKKQTMIIQALQKSFEERHGKARALINELQRWQQDGYVEKKYNAKEVYDELVKLLTNIPFKYDGFRKYY